MMGCLLLAAFLLRATGISFGLNHPDEHLIINHALAFGNGDLNPHMFYFPTLFLYLLFAVFGGFYAAGRISGHFLNPDQFLQFFLQSPETFYILGRLVSVFFGVATVYVIYCLGREFRSRAVGVWSALFLAVNFLHVRDSHFATMDIALTFFMTLGVYYLIRYVNGQDPKAYWKAIIATGAATAIKYNGFLILLPAGIAYLFENRTQLSVIRVFRAAFLSALLFIAVFFCLSPYVLLDFKVAQEFIQKLYELNRGLKVGWFNHLWTLSDALGWPLFFLAAAGLFLQYRRWEIKNTILFVFALAYYVMITKAGQPFERYVLVLIPIVLLWAADFIEMGIGYFATAKQITWRRIMIGVLILITILPKMLYQEILFLKKDTRTIAAEWIASNIHSGERLLLDDPGECPRLTPSPDQIRQQIARLNPADTHYSQKKKRLQARLDLSPYPAANYELRYLSGSPDKAGFTTLMDAIPYSVEETKKLGADYLITSQRSVSANLAFYKALEPSLELCFTVDPRQDVREGMSPHGWTYLPIDHYLWNIARPGPLLYVFKLKKS